MKEFSVNLKAVVLVAGCVVAFTGGGKSLLNYHWHSLKDPTKTVTSANTDVPLRNEHFYPPNLPYNTNVQANMPAYKKRTFSGRFKSHLIIHLLLLKRCKFCCC